MKISCSGLWKILIDKDTIKRMANACELSPVTLFKMGRGEFISMNVLCHIRTKLGADFGDMVSIIEKGK